jgi:hypothetical protein
VHDASKLVPAPVGFRRGLQQGDVLADAVALERRVRAFEHNTCVAGEQHAGVRDSAWVVDDLNSVSVAEGKQCRFESEALGSRCCCFYSNNMVEKGNQLTNGFVPKPVSDLTAEAIVSKNCALAPSYWAGVSSKKMPCIPSPEMVRFPDHAE